MRSALTTILILTLFCVTADVYAASGTYDGLGDSDWVTGGTNGDDDWSGASYPGFGAGETATFTGTSPVAVSSGNAPANAVTIEVNGGDIVINIADGVTLDVTDLTYTTANNISFANAGTGATVTLAGLSTATSGTLTVGANVTLQVTGAADFSNLTVTNNGTIQFGGTFSVTAAGNLGGTVEVTSGTVTFDADPTASTFNVSGGAQANFTTAVDFTGDTLDIAGTIDFGATLAITGAASLSGTGTANVSTGTVTFDGGPGIGNLTIAATTTASFSSAPDFSATTVTNSGTVDLGGTFTVTGAGALNGTVSITSGTVTFDADPGAGTLNVSAAATAAFSTALDFSTTTINNNGTIDLGGTFSVTSATALNGDVTVSSDTVTFDGGPGAATLTVSAGATAGFSGAPDFSATTVTNGGTVDLGGTFTVIGAGALNGTVAVTSGTVTFDADPGAGTLNVSGGATAVFTTNVDLGTTTVTNSGTIQFDASTVAITVSSSSALNGAVSAIGGNIVDFAAGLDCASLSINGAGNHTVTGTLTLSGALTKNGAGTFSVTSLATLSGNITVGAGTLDLADTQIGTTGAAGVSVTLDVTSTANISGTLDIVAANSGNNQLTVAGAGTTTVGGDTTIAAGAGAAGNGSTLILDTNVAVTFEGGLSAAAATDAADGATLQLEGGSTLTLGPTGGGGLNTTFSLGRHSDLVVNGGGTRANIATNEAYTMSLDGDATIDGLNIGGYDISGLQLTTNFGEGGAGSNSVTNVTFQDGQAGGTHLTVVPNLVTVLGSVANATWTEILFDATPGTGGNVAVAQTPDTSALKVSNGADDYGDGHTFTAADAEAGSGNLGGDNDGADENNNITWGATNNAPVLQTPNATGDITVSGSAPSFSGGVLLGGDLAISFEATDADGDTLTTTVTRTGGTLSAADAGFNETFPFAPAGTPSPHTVSLSGTAANTGNIEFTVSVDDGNGGNDSYTIEITISAAPTITVTAPNGGEEWLIGQNATITWNSSGIAGNVDILLSTDSGGSFPTTLLTNVANSGSETITVPNNPTTQARVRVQETGGGGAMDDSDGDFEIRAALPADATLTAGSGNPGNRNANAGSVVTALVFRVTETNGETDYDVNSVTVTIALTNNTGGAAESMMNSVALRRGGSQIGSINNGAAGWTSGGASVTVSFTGLTEAVAAGTSADFQVVIAFNAGTVPSPNPGYSASIDSADINSGTAISGGPIAGGVITLREQLPDDPFADDDDDDSCDLSTRGGPAWPVLLLAGVVGALAFRRRKTA